ncbi:phage tail sheath subtilisin-like domain-containing protein [Sphingomonas psychrotolerans]|uniref:Phage tail sheath subtilisin-like domain-containing protein n=1 Tax=Sphingomonas psychrotolerans TaxID=1327635 RepID=A0ABU3NBP9_9SPHN|nr:phage tail sheath C-terminal domain-containing protein [Sphingomonas psychrotolerans]MDT8760906.1 phage tail sheath subtilisin-like domain-containing protein [Sphingomonas psychrotolerans]
MPAALSYPGVYIEEVPSGVRTITGVATSIAAFVGRTATGPINEPVVVNSFGDFERRFGGLSLDRPLSYAVRDFYVNGGGQALIVRLFSDPAVPDDAVAKLNVDGLVLAAASPGIWGRKLRATIDADVSDEIRTRLGLAPADALFNLTLRYGNISEKFLNVSVADNPRRIDRVLAAQSNLAVWSSSTPPNPVTDKLPLLAKAVTAREALEEALAAAPPVPADIDKARSDLAKAQLALSDAASQAEAELATAIASGNLANIATARDKVKTAETAMKGSEGEPLDAAAYIGTQADKTGIYALDSADLFNLLCIPPDVRTESIDPAVYQSAMEYCRRHRAMLLVDSPFEWSANPVTAPADAVAGLPALGLSGEGARNAALYFPPLLEADPLRDGQTDIFVPCGAVAGIMARTDSTRGVWKAPAGLDAAINGIQGLVVKLNDAENGMLNPLGINCLRAFPTNGRVVWGARTLRGADQLGDEYKYVSVRRTALFIEESLYRGTQWVVFEPNDEPLWSQIRLNVGAFMNGLFRQGAFQGKTPAEAYFVKCDKETTPQNDINLGIVNIVVGFAPLKPAEFVIVKLQQIAGQIQV